jgi:hypothetical protein
MSGLAIWLSIAGITVTSLVTRTALLFVGPSFRIGPRLTAAPQPARSPA